MTMTERAAAARQRHEELVEILTNAVFDLYLRDRNEAASRRRPGRGTARLAAAGGSPASSSPPSPSP